MDDYVAKPFSPERLYEVIARSLGKDHEVAEHEARDDSIGLIAVEQTTDLSPLPEIPGLDRSLALSYARSDDARYLELLREFRQNYAGFPEALGKAAGNGELRDVHTVVHGLKSAAYYIGARDLSERASVLNEALHGTDEPQGISSEDLEQELVAVLRSLEVLDEHPSSSEGSRDAPSEGSRRARELIAELREHLEGDRAASEESLRKLRAALATHDLDERLDELKGFVEDVEYEKALRLLERIDTDLDHSSSG